MHFLTELECRAGDWAARDEYAEAVLQAGEQWGLESEGAAGLCGSGSGRCVSRPPRPSSGPRHGRSRRSLAWKERYVPRPNLAVLGLIDLSTGDYPAAAERLGPLVRRRQERGAGEPSAFPARDPIEAVVAVGDLDEARVQLEWLEEAGRSARDSVAACDGRPPGLLQAAEGDLEAALASCEQALEVHERMPVPFERAAHCSLTARCFVAWKRRHAAREAIVEALSIFESLPAPVWAAQARAAVEHACIGGRASSGSELTPSERRIAEVVAAGMTNKEAAAALFLSVQSVEDALKWVYRKLGSAPAPSCPAG